MKNIIAVAILLCIFIGLSVSSMLENSGTCDEIAHHIPVGVIMLTKGDLKMDTSQPPLARYIMVLPVVLFLNPIVPSGREIWRINDRGIFGRDFFFKYNIHPKRILFVSRMMILLIGIACGMLVFIWTKSLFGKHAAFCSLFLYVLSPEILAHTQLATTDMVATFFIFLSCYTFWKFSKNANIINILYSGVSLGLAQLSKYSALILYPIFIILMTLYFRNPECKIQKNIFIKLFLIFFISVLAIWAGYGFSLKPILKDAVRVEEKLEFIDNKMATFFPSWNTNSKNRVNNFLLHTPMPLGEHLLGVLGIVKHGQGGHKTYFLGHWSNKGNIFYFIVAFLIKTPLPLLLLLICGIFTLYKNTPPLNRYFLAVPPLIYSIVALFSNLQIGARHLLPIYPFCFILAASSIYLLKDKIFRIIFAILCMWYTIGSSFVWPHYLSYFNEFVGGPNNGWKYLRDSNIDWGQDLPALKKYMHQNNINEITLKYFGQDDPHMYGINFKEFSENEHTTPQNKVYAISVQYLEHAHWGKTSKPTQKAGYSIFIYDFRDFPK